MTIDLQSDLAEGDSILKVGYNHPTKELFIYSSSRVYRAMISTDTIEEAKFLEELDNGKVSLRDKAGKIYPIIQLKDGILERSDYGSKFAPHVESPEDFLKELQNI